MVRGKEGHMSVPTKAGAVVGGIVAAGFGTFWTIFTGFGAAAVGAAGGPPIGVCFPVIGLVIIFGGIAAAISGYGKAEKFERAQAGYRQRRSELMYRDK